MSWQVVQPFIAQYSANHHLPPHSSRTKPSHPPQPELGGGILVLDLESYQNSRFDEDERSQEKKTQEANHSSSSSDTLPIITHFISHVGESLSVMSFSPTGLKLASADTNGQVILVHALVPSGLISHPHQVVGLLSTNRPYLLYKLVRGLTLAKIIDIGFDNSESIAFASSFNGTVHIFDLKSTTTESSEIRSTPSSWSRSSLHEPGTSPLNPLNLLGMNGYLGGNNSNGSSHSNHPPPMRSDGEDHVPLINVSQFLQLHRPDLRTLHGYSEMKIKLPLRDSPLHESNSGNGAPKKDDPEASDDEQTRDRLPSDADNHATPSANSLFFPEVNMNSSLVILPSVNYLSRSTDGAAQPLDGNKYEILIGTSEGILSRYLVTLKSVTPNQSTPNSVRELNRWDLCSPLAMSVFTPPPSEYNSPSSSSTSWITAVGHRSDQIIDIQPVWMRPQCTLRVYSQDNDKDSPNEKIVNGKKHFTTPTAAFPIPIESSATTSLRKKSKSSQRHHEVADTDELTEKMSQLENLKGNFLFFPERRRTNLLQVDRQSFVLNSSSEIGEKIHSALVASLPEVQNSEHKSHVVITKRIDDISAWEMDEDWEAEAT
jgi:hypothetical protein